MLGMMKLIWNSVERNNDSSLTGMSESIRYGLMNMLSTHLNNDPSYTQSYVSLSMLMLKLNTHQCTLSFESISSPLLLLNGSIDPVSLMTCRVLFNHSIKRVQLLLGNRCFPAVSQASATVRMD